MNEVQNELTRIVENVASTYAVLDDSGADMPATQNSNNLPATAASVRDKVIRYNVLSYGATGNDTTDDTAAFQAALAAERVVRVPGGTYKLSGTLVIRENCCLELSQDTILVFTKTSGNCIEMRGSAVLRGNHGIIQVPYAFTGNAISMDTALDGTPHNSIPPYAKSDPQWKRQRFLYDVNIVKPTADGFCRTTNGTCTGTAIYMSAEGTASITWMWGISMSGIRIAGGFAYGIRAVNFDDPNDSTVDDAWNHDMRIEAVIEACEIGVALENCNAAHLQVTVQPCQATNGAVYAKHGVYLSDARAIDMIGSRIWDWTTKASLWTDGGQYQHIAMIGNCRGLLLDDFNYYEFSGYDIRDLIYTDTPSNLERMTILQEPFTRWFRPVDGKPMYYDGLSDREIQLKDDPITPAQVGFIQDAEGEYVTTPDFTNRVTGYQDGAYLKSDGTVGTLAGYVTTDFIPIDGAAVHTYRIGGKGITWKDQYYYGRICWYDANKQLMGSCLAWNKVGENIYYPQWVTDDTVAAAIITSANNSGSLNAAYFKISAAGSGADLIVTIDEEQTYTTKWEGTPGMLDESVYAQKTLVRSPGGKLFELKVSDAGVLTAVEYSW